MSGTPPTPATRARARLNSLRAGADAGGRRGPWPRPTEYDRRIASVRYSLAPRTASTSVVAQGQARGDGGGVRAARAVRVARCRCAARRSSIEALAVEEDVHGVALEVPALHHHRARPRARRSRAASRISSRVRTGRPSRASASGRFGVRTVASGNSRST